MSISKTSVMIWTIGNEYDPYNYIVNGNLLALSTTLGSYEVGMSHTQTNGVQFISFFGTNFYGYKSDRHGNKTTSESTYVLNINYNGITSNYTTLSTIGNVIRETTMPIYIHLSSFFNGTLSTYYYYGKSYKIIRKSTPIEITGGMVLSREYNDISYYNSSNFYTSSTHPSISTLSTSTYISKIVTNYNQTMLLTLQSYSGYNGGYYNPTNYVNFPSFQSISASKTVQPVYYSTEKETITSTYSLLYG